MKRTLEEEEIPTHVRTDAVSDLQLCATPVDTTGAKANLERTITMPIAADVWIGHIIPRLSALSILSLQLTCHDGAFLVEKSVMKYNDPLLDKSEKEYHIPLFREIKETDQDGGRSDIIMQILSSGTSLVQLEWFIDLESRSLPPNRRKYFVENYGNTHFVPILNIMIPCIIIFNRMDFVKNFKSFFINNLRTIMSESNPMLRFVGCGPRFEILQRVWKNFLCWLVKEAEISLLIELMKGLNTHIELIEYHSDLRFANSGLFGLLLLRDNEDLLDIYLDPHSKYTKDLPAYIKYFKSCKSVKIYNKWIWGRIERFCKSEKVFMWCHKNLPPQPSTEKVYSTFAELVEFQKLEFATDPKGFYDDTPATLIINSTY